MKKILLVLLCIFTLTTTAMDIPQGTLITDQIPIDPNNMIKSPAADDQVRLVTIYLPPNFDPTDQNTRYPVIYYLPGLGGTNETFTVGNKFILDQLIGQELMRPLIVVHVDPSLVNGIDEDGFRRYEGSWYVNSELNKNFEDYIVETLVSYIDENYPTIPTAAFRGIMGQSMGGYGALFIATRHPDVFSCMGSASGTTYWCLLNVFDQVLPGDIVIPSPGDQMFVLNSLLLPEIPTKGPNAGKIVPENGEFSFFFYSNAAAHSPNLDNPPYYVDLPFEIDEDHKPMLVTGNFTIADPTVGGSGTRIPSNVSLVPRQDVIDRWRENDNYIFMNDFVETLKKQAIYVDGGDLELINARGERALSDKMSDLGIDHEYLLYNGTHESNLTGFTSRHRTMFQKFAAKFAEAGNYPDDIRSKIIGTGTICFQDSAHVYIQNFAQLGIETSPDLNVPDTNISIVLMDQSHIKIGSDEQITQNNSIIPSQGALQIGNRFSKARLQGDPSLADHEIRCTIIINGPKATFEIAKEGFFGFGAAINGQETIDPNQWSVTTATNVKNLTLDIRKGRFIHNNIAVGNETNASLFAIGLSDLYTFKIDPDNAVILGGGNITGVPNSILNLPVVQDTVGTISPGGIRLNLETEQGLLDFFYKRPMSSSVFYTNNNNIGTAVSTGLLDNQPVLPPNPFEIINESSFEVFCDYMAIDENDTFEVLSSKEGAIAKNNGNVCLTYVDDNKTIIRIPESDIPVGSQQTLDLNQLAEQDGYVDIVIRMVNGQARIIRVDDPTQ